MAEIRVVNIYKYRFVNDPNVKEVYIGRESKKFGQKESIFANKWSHMPNSVAEFKVATREEAVEENMKWLRRCWAGKEGIVGAGVKIRLQQLAKNYLDGKDIVLICFCEPLLCHGDNIRAAIIGAAAQIEHTEVRDGYKEVSSD